MSLFSKYLDREDLAELRKRSEHINQQLLMAHALKMMKNDWLVTKFKKYGLDNNKPYEFNPKNGQIKEIKKDGLPKNKKDA